MSKSENLPLIPFDISNELNQYSKVYISKELDYFRIIHCCELNRRDYKIFGELPNGDKKILFTARKHFQCCNCNCIIFCCLYEYVCCDKIIFQMDYKRNNIDFYTQGVNVKKGCYCSRCYCCQCGCCPQSELYLRENIDADNPDFDFGVHKGKTSGTINCCKCLRDRTVTYTNEEGVKGPNVRLLCCEICKRNLGCCCCNCFNCQDFEIFIEDANGQRTGNIIIPNGCFSSKVDGKSCFCPRKHYEINFPTNASSNEKFQIIADVIHFDLENGLI